MGSIDLTLRFSKEGLTQDQRFPTLYWVPLPSHHTSIPPTVPLLVAGEYTSNVERAKDECLRIKQLMQTDSSIQVPLEVVPYLKSLPMVAIVPEPPGEAAWSAIAHSFKVVLVSQPSIMELDAGQLATHLLGQMTTALPLQAVVPYQREGPVLGTRFFGRENIIQSLVEMREKNYVVTGIRRIGKSSLMNEVELRLRARGVANICKCSGEEATSVGDILRAIAGEIDASESKNIVREHPEAWDRADIVRFFRRISLKGRRQLTLLIDEVGEILEFDAAREFPFLHALRVASEEQLCVSYLAGDRRLAEAVAKNTNPLWNYGEKFELERFYREEVSQLIRRPLGEVGVAIDRPTEVVGEIFRVSNGHPQVVQYLLVSIVNEMVEKGTRELGPGLVSRTINNERTMEYYRRTVESEATPLMLAAMWQMALDDDQHKDSDRTSPSNYSVVLEQLWSKMVREWRITSSEADFETAIRALVHVGVVSIDEAQRIAFGSPIYAMALRARGRNLKADIRDIAIRHLFDGKTHAR